IIQRLNNIFLSVNKALLIVFSLHFILLAASIILLYSPYTVPLLLLYNMIGLEFFFILFKACSVNVRDNLDKAFSFILALVSSLKVLPLFNLPIASLRSSL